MMMAHEAVGVAMSMVVVVVMVVIMLPSVRPLRIMVAAIVACLVRGTHDGGRQMRVPESTVAAGHEPGEQ
jgi:hypothetical protein